MKRREFIIILCSAPWAPSSRAQDQGGSVRQIGVLINRTSVAPAYARALCEGLETLGWVDGKNIQVEFLWTAGDVDRLRSDAGKLAALGPEVIVSAGTQATRALRVVTQTIPIVFVHVADPLSGGIVQSLARPGGNITGFAAYESAISANTSLL
jgi:putative ABC transport system substrate-binding protein